MKNDIQIVEPTVPHIFKPIFDTTYCVIELKKTLK